MDVMTIFPPEGPGGDELSQAPGKGLGGLPQPHVEVPVSKQRAVQKSIVARYLTSM